MYLNQEPTTFLNIKLTDDGRRLLSLGQLTYSKALLSDREIDYKIDLNGDYDICNNKILSPSDNNPFITSNFDGSPSIQLSQASVSSSRQIITAQTDSVGFFTGTTNTFGIDETKYLGQSYIPYSAGTPDGSDTVAIWSGASGAFIPTVGNLAYVIWSPPQNSGNTITGLEKEVSGTNPTLSNWYSVMSVDESALTVQFDRPVPNFGVTDSNSTQVARMFFYPKNGVDTFYGSATTIQTSVWNMNIVRTSSEIGSDSTVSGYTNYGSIEYNGTKHYLGFSSETRQIGIIHYSNLWSGNTYAEQLVEKSTTLDIPNIMWHKYPANNGSALNYGIQLTDAASTSIFDNVSQTNYTDLRDGTSTNSNVVGRVYSSLQVIVITDPELLTALSYKSNRNYTLPALNLNLITAPKHPLTTSEATASVTSGKTYFATYVIESENPASGTTSFGYPQSLHCGYISQIKGEVDANGEGQYLTANFATNSFPYLRSETNMTSSSAFSGTGWNANKIQLLIQSADNTLSTNPQIDTLPTDGWTLVSTTAGNGIYTGDGVETTIDPLKLNGYQFVISQEDIDSGSTYSIASTLPYSSVTTNQEVLNFGDEAFFFGNLTTAIKATAFKTTFTILAKNTEFNSSLNESFNGLNNADTFITEIGILDNNNVLVGVGKPSYPLKKSDARFLAFQLEIDF